MQDIPLPPHPPAFRRLCERAIALFQALLPADVHERARLVPQIRHALEDVQAEAERLDLRLPGFAAEQGLLVDASSALQSIDMDRGGPRVPHWVERAVADLRRVAGD
jgi:hypothetical protein